MAAEAPPSKYLLTASGVQGHGLVLLNPGHADFLGHTAGSGGCLRPRDRPGTSPSVKRQRPPPTAFTPPASPALHHPAAVTPDPRRYHLLLQRKLRLREGDQLAPKHQSRLLAGAEPTQAV